MSAGTKVFFFPGHSSLTTITFFLEMKRGYVQTFLGAWFGGNHAKQEEDTKKRANTDTDDFIEIDGVKYRRMKNVSQVLQASIRTDAIANPVYFRRLKKALNDGFIIVDVPRKGKMYVDVTKADAISFWSKDYKALIEDLQKSDSVFHPFIKMFNFTLNGEVGITALENVTRPLDERMNQLYYLAFNYGAETVNPRFDPVVFWTENDGLEYNNLAQFTDILDFIDGVNDKLKAEERKPIDRLTFSLAVPHDKVVKRMERHGRFLVNLDEKRKKIILQWMALETKKRGIRLLSCCDDQLLGYSFTDPTNGETFKLAKSICTPRSIVAEKLKAVGKDIRVPSHGNRDQCACVKTTDIFGYEPCLHGCDYCYANPLDSAIRRPENASACEGTLKDIEDLF